MPPKDKEKDSQSPKEPLTALDFYVQARRQEEEKEAATSVLRYKMEFDNLSDIDKARWYKLAKMDRIRYRREMATYEPPIDDTSSTPILAIMGRLYTFRWYNFDNQGGSKQFSYWGRWWHRFECMGWCNASHSIH